MPIYGGAAAAAFLMGYFLMDIGYGPGTLFRAAFGERGKDTSCSWDIQDLAREYFLRCYAFPKWVSLLMLPLVLGSFVCFVGTVVTWNPKSPFVTGELSCVSVLALMALLPLRMSRQGYLKRRLFSEDRGYTFRNRIKETEISRPLLLLDVATFRPSWVALTFFGTALIGNLLLNFPGVVHQLSLPVTLPLWILEVANLFAFPIFLGFSLIGLFPWPPGTVEDRLYYPLLVLKRSVEKRPS
ncbi:hypothetical protein JKG47_01770 [Acidithiobacillus sp. MC6.1]|nr:hypothetical protein [Acidithiobacillus sp. MC6.1]